MALCAGIGGIEVGLKILCPRYRTVCYVEREASAAAALVARMESEALDKAPVWSEIESFDGKPWRGIVDIVTSGFPCQPFSVSGKRKGIKDERWLWASIARVLSEIRPAFAFFENVPAIITDGLGPILGDLARLGYDVEWSNLPASAVGAPFIGNRIFVLAVLQTTRLDGSSRRLLEASRDRRPQYEPRRLSGDAVAAKWWTEETWSHLRPSVLRMANGIPFVVDRLRSLGNAVVPLHAAAAFDTLWERIVSDN